MFLSPVDSFHTSNYPPKVQRTKKEACLVGQRHGVILSIVLISSFIFFSCLVQAQDKPKPEIETRIIPVSNSRVDENDDIYITKDTRAVWLVEIVVDNTTPDTYFQGVNWLNAYDEGIEILDIALTKGSVFYNSSLPAEINWQIGILPPGETALLRFNAATRVTDEGKNFYLEIGCQSLVSDGDLVYRLPNENTWEVIKSVIRQLCVEEAPPWVTVSLTSRKDWRLRRPGCYASEATVIELASNGSVAITFDEFDNLVNVDDPFAPSIPMWYAWGEDFNEALWHGWIPVNSFNGTEKTYGPPLDLESGISETLWNQICIDPEHPAGHYENEAMITIALRGGSTWIDP